LVASKLIVIMSLVAVAIGAIVVLSFMALSVSGNSYDLQLPFGDGGMRRGMMMMMMEGSRMQMPASKDVIILLESEYEMTAQKQSQVTLKVLDKRTNEPVQGAKVIIGIEKGLPMTTMDMTGGSGMFDAIDKGNGTYTFDFTPQSKGYYTVHAHVIPPGKQMHSMMENYVDLIVLSR
jgi:hypothetical protein